MEKMQLSGVRRLIRNCSLHRVELWAEIFQGNDHMCILHDGKGTRVERMSLGKAG